MCVVCDRCCFDNLFWNRLDAASISITVQLAAYPKCVNADLDAVTGFCRLLCDCSMQELHLQLLHFHIMFVNEALSMDPHMCCTCGYVLLVPPAVFGLGQKKRSNSQPNHQKRNTFNLRSDGLFY